VCEPECPWEAIFEDEQVPDVFRDDTPLNAKIVGVAEQRAVPEKEDKTAPTPEQVEENKRKWGYVS
jgi:ferredoxin